MTRIDFAYQDGASIFIEHTPILEHAKTECPKTVGPTLRIVYSSCGYPNSRHGRFCLA